MSHPDTAAVRRAWGWVAALRAGATTSWQEWRGEAAPESGRLPGAQQLELLRRLNLAHPDVVSPDLADRVLAADAPGRGRADLPLTDVEAPSYGPLPVDPAGLADEELLRVTTGLLAEDLAGEGARHKRNGRDSVENAAISLVTTSPRRKPWAPSYRLAGDDWQVAPIREDVGKVRPERERPRRAYVVGADLATMLAHAWTARAFAESGAGWTAWLGRFVEHDRLPHRADLAAIAKGWAEAIGPRRVTIVTEPQRLTRPLRLVRHRIPEPPTVTAAGVDLARRVSTTLGILVPADERTRLLRERLLPRLPTDSARGIAVPPEWHDWVRARAEQMRAELTEAGYPVIGEPDRLVPRAPAADTDPATADVLALALHLLVEHHQPGPGTEEMT